MFCSPVPSRCYLGFYPRLISWVTETVISNSLRKPGHEWGQRTKVDLVITLHWCLHRRLCPGRKSFSDGVPHLLELVEILLIKSWTHSNIFWESKIVHGVKLPTSQKIFRDGWQHSPHPCNPTPSMDSPHPSPPERRDEPGLVLGLVASFTPWYTGQKGAQGWDGLPKSRAGLSSRLSGGLPRKDGSWLNFSHPSSVTGRETRGVRGMRKRRAWGQYCTVCSTPTTYCPALACWGKMSSINASSTWLCLWVSWKHVL